MNQVIKIFIVAIFLFWPPALIYLVTYSNLSQTDEISKKIEGMVFLERHTQSLIQNGLLVDACSYLNDAYKRNSVSAYYLEGESTTCGKPEELRSDSFPTVEVGRIHEINTKNGNFFYKKLKSNNTDLTVALLKPKKMNLLELLLLNPKGMLTAIVIDTLISIWIVSALWMTFVLRNIEVIRQVYRKSHTSPIWFRLFDKVARFLEPNRGFSPSEVHRTAASEIRKLKEERSYYADTLEYAIIDDLKKSPEIKFPYSFEGTVVRVDINGYGQYIYDGNRQYLAEMKRSFEWLAAECAYRYGGLFEGRAGDMVVYVFRGAQTELRAAAFYRDFSEQFSVLRFNFLHQKDVALFVKASIATSLLTMESSPSKYDFDGDALYLTDRMFGSLDEQDKMKNILILFPSDFGKIECLAQAPYCEKQISKKEAQLTVCYVDKFKQFNEFPKPTLFLGDMGIREQLKSIGDSRIEAQIRQDTLDDLLKSLRVKKIHQEISNDWLKTLLKVTHDRRQNILMSSLISLGKVVVPKSNWSYQISDKVLEISDAFDARSIANAIELFASWDDFSSIGKIYEKISPTDEAYRAQGNFLLVTTLSNTTEENLQRVREMLTSSNDRLRDTGIFVAATLIVALRESSATSLITFDGYHEISKILESTNPASTRLIELKKKALNE